MTTQQVEQVNKDLYRYAGRNLEAGGDKIPLVEFRGFCTEWDAQPSPFPNDNSIFLVFKFDKVQVLKLRDDSQPYPYDQAELKIKHSASQRSGFGFLQASINRALGITDDVSDLEMMVGKEWHLKAEPYNWGKIPNATNADAQGNVWGEIWVAQLSTGAVAQPASANPTSAATAQPVAQAQAAEQTAETVLLDLIHGKNKADFLPEALTHPTVKADQALVANIVQETWIASMIAQGKITLDETSGIYTVVGR